MVSPSSRQILKGFSVPLDLSRPALISCWRASSCAGRHRLPGSEALGVGHGVGAGYESAEDAADQRIGAEAVGAVVLIFGLAGGEDAGDVGHLVEVDPQAAHGVVHAGEDLHGHFAGSSPTNFS
jgi:hypothetical protein